jgi:hypothetical protein
VLTLGPCADEHALGQEERERERQERNHDGAVDHGLAQERDGREQAEAEQVVLGQAKSCLQPRPALLEKLVQAEDGYQQHPDRDRKVAEQDESRGAGRGAQEAEDLV